MTMGSVEWHWEEMVAETPFGGPGVNIEREERSLGDPHRGEIKPASGVLNVFPSDPGATFSHCRGETAPRYHHWGSQPAGEERTPGKVRCGGEVRCKDRDVRNESKGTQQRNA